MDAPPVQYVTTSDGVSIAYAIVGNGMPLIHIPIVWSNFSLQWTTGINRTAFEALAQRFQLVLYDGRGSGMSTRGISGEMSLDHIEADLDAVAGQLEAPRFLLLTSSPHGVTAIRYAAKHPERVAGVVLHNYIDTSIATFSAPLRAMAEVDWQTHLMSQALAFSRRDQELVTRVLRESLTQSELLAITGALRSESTERLLAGLQVPVLVMASRSGTSARPHEEAGRWLAARIPHAQLQIFDGRHGGWEAEEGGVAPALLAIERFAEGLKASEPASETTDVLSAREVEVLRLIAAGRSNAQIAEALVISPNTVGRHVSNIFDKIGAANRAEATAYALRHGIA